MFNKSDTSPFETGVYYSQSLINQYNEDDFLLEFRFLPIFQTAETQICKHLEKLSNISLSTCKIVIRKMLVRNQSLINEKSSSLY